MFGIHGSMLMYVAMGSIANAMWAENMVAFGNGLPAPHPEWLYMYFVNLGGSGATLGLVLLMAFIEIPTFKNVRKSCITNINI